MVNDTSKPAYGFEIEIEDPSFNHTKITSVFGLNRVFPSVSLDPTAVVRFGAYGAPIIEDISGFGVRITYGGVIGSTFTPGIPYTGTPNDSCWPGANPGWQSASCDHFGVSTIGSPAKTTYKWLVETSPGSGVLTTQQVGIPAVSIAYTPPAVPGGVGMVNAVIEAIAPNPVNPGNPLLWGEPLWLNTYTTNVGREIDLGDLLRGDPDQEAAEIEIERSVFQMAPIGENGANEMNEADVALNSGEEAVIRRYEFYKYLGPVNPEDGEAQCENPANCGGEGAVVGAFVGAQLAGFNAVAAAPAAVPEPGAWAMLAVGLGAIVYSTRKRRAA